ncbi:MULTISPECIES: rhomboid family intramembrane serine protease [Paenarthrobacter]|uniref:Rhomboid family intramembrane serine protease n=1 Tax=Paenarthrobacter ureafaciens TaxID=37931 RepID=A0AAX3EJF0_PAEUR|nr:MULTISPECIES: rhomboid family intramembrane serine protease [Paenarthrobacter]NKR11578.1 rhomboid family intramembrane serine protease [Arthrobacter sp. M5]NKR16329.1 rhomboid family intramembrane serine protease [Arthrobacter sp. M6]OEH57561.1 rhomboid family intramembrane serine protease [Arthrobacter sp. D4]OEH58836.1 rhomboid family intramembrane serine protease [Arthrobacter sp. D2]MDO5862642.1 rhomboid family intramembrane serine protease [Paenarthrobacter sp. SD-2]
MSYGIPSAEPSADIPVCPRHPDRPSYVRCQRCGRPACPECQRAAAVGFQCVDCVNEQKRTTPAYRAPYGGALAVGKPLVTYAIIALCVLVYVLQWLLPGEAVYQQFAFANVFADREPWRMLTAAFLHSQSFLLHIVLNMYTLWIFGQALEPLLGRVRFLAVYLLSAVGGSIGFLLLTPDRPVIGVVGASGAIFGLFGAMLVVQRHRGGETRQLWVLIAINGAIGFFVQGIAWQAHLGGLITGGLAAAAIAYAPRGKNQGLLQAGGLVLVGALLAIVTWFRISA